jgi:hypothetical protein
MKPARARRERCPAVLALVLLLSACATIPERSFCQDGRGASEDRCVADARKPHWDFLLRKERELNQSSSSEEDGPPPPLRLLKGRGVAERGLDIRRVERPAPFCLTFSVSTDRQIIARRVQDRAAVACQSGS